MTPLCYITNFLPQKLGPTLTKSWICAWFSTYQLKISTINFSPYLLPTNKVWGKVIFLHLFVILFTGRGAWSQEGLLRGGAWSGGGLGPGVVSAPRGVRVPGGDPRDGHCCGRYASYWNAFLLTKWVKCNNPNWNMQINLNSQKYFLKFSTDYLNGPLWLGPHDERLNNCNQSKNAYVAARDYIRHEHLRRCKCQEQNCRKHWMFLPKFFCTMNNVTQLCCYYHLQFNYPQPAAINTLKFCGSLNYKMLPVLNIKIWKYTHDTE